MWIRVTDERFLKVFWAKGPVLLGVNVVDNQFRCGMPKFFTDPLWEHLESYVFYRRKIKFFTLISSRLGLKLYSFLRKNRSNATFSTPKGPHTHRKSVIFRFLSHNEVNLRKNHYQFRKNVYFCKKKWIFDKSAIKPIFTPY